MVNRTANILRICLEGII